MQRVHLSADELTERAALLSGVLRPLAHQLSNDVTFLASTLELALAYDVPAALKPTLQQASAFAQDMCDELRRAARAVRPAAAENLAPVSAAELFDAALELAAGVSGVVRLQAATHAQVVVDVGLWAQALAALLDNASEAGATEVTVHWSDAPGPLCCEVRDNGSGFKAGALEGALLPFVTTKPLPHRGIGLALVQGVVAAHHGELTIESGADGTVVRLFAPVAAVGTHEPAIQVINR